MCNQQFADSYESTETEHAGGRTSDCSDGDLDERGTVPSLCSRRRGFHKSIHTLIYAAIY
jgi:hypothetical protein